MVENGSLRSRKIQADPTLPLSVLHAVDFENQFWEERLSHCLVVSLECQAFKATSAQRLGKGSAAEAQGGPQLQRCPAVFPPASP